MPAKKQIKKGKLTKPERGKAVKWQGADEAAPDGMTNTGGQSNQAHGESGPPIPADAAALPELGAGADEAPAGHCDFTEDASESEPGSVGAHFPEEGGAFDAAAICEERGIFRLNRKDGAYFMRAPDRAFVALALAELKRLVRKSVRIKPDPERGEIESEFDKLLEHIIWHRRVDYVLDGYAGYEAGAYDCAGVRVLAMKSPRHLTPAAGEWPTILTFIRQLLPTGEDGVDQAEIFLGWLQVAARAVRGGPSRSGQMLLLVGKKDDGKSRLQHFIISPILGGRNSDPSGWLLGEGDFNSECFGSEHLLMEDTPASLKRDERNKFKQRLKGVAVNDTHRYHEKGRPAVTLRPIWRLSMSLNDSPDDLSLLPDPVADFTEKTIMLATARPAYLPASDDEREAWRNALAQEMPAFLHYILNVFTLPDAYRGGRFGVRSYENPGIRQQLEDAAPWAQMWEVLEEIEPWKNGPGGAFWKGKLHEIEALLTDAPDGNGEAMERLLKKNSLAYLLNHVKAEKPGRVDKTRTGGKGFGRYWLLWRPRQQGESARPVVEQIQPDLTTL